jgi:hypothetical protein
MYAIQRFRRRRVDGNDASMSVRAPEDLPVQHSGQGQVIRVHFAPGGLGMPFVPPIAAAEHRVLVSFETGYVLGVFRQVRLNGIQLIGMHWAAPPRVS